MFSNYFLHISLIHDYGTRSKTNKNLFLPHKNLNYGQFGAKYAAVKNWNEIPVEIKTGISIQAFGNKYKDHLLKTIVIIRFLPTTLYVLLL